MASRRRLSAKSSSKLEAPPQITLDPEQQAKFDQELAWCIRKLNNLLQVEKEPKKYEEYVKADKVLRNSTMTLIKKRGLMANLFGDYRTKMKQDEANCSNNKNTAKIVTTDQNKLIKKAKFVRKSNARSDPSDTTKSGCNDELKKALSNLTIKDDNTNTGEVESKKIPESCAAQTSKFNITGGNSDFKFNFVI